MNEAILKEWIEEVWSPNIEPNQSYLLIWDSFAPHGMKAIRASIRRFRH